MTRDVAWRFPAAAAMRCGGNTEVSPHHHPRHDIDNTLCRPLQSVTMKAVTWVKMLTAGGALCIGGPALVYYVSPSEEELFKVR